MLDAIDLKIVELLAARGRITWAELGEVLGLSAPAAAERVHKLEARGVLRGYSAQLDPHALGLALLAFVEVTLEHPQHRQAFLALVRELPQVQECHHIAGDYDYLVKIRCRGTQELEYLLSERIKGLTGIARTRTTIVLATSKETAALPLPTEPETAP